MTNNLIKLLRDGADICHARNINLDYAKVATQAADEIERLRSVIQLIYDNSIKVDWPDDIWDAIKGELK